MTKATLSISQLAAHKTRNDLWIAVHGNVYDVSSFASDHPGGVDVLIECAGTDGTETYDYAGHSEDALDTLHRFQVGVLEGRIDRSPADISMEDSGLLPKMAKQLVETASPHSLAWKPRVSYALITVPILVIAWNRDIFQQLGIRLYDITGTSSHLDVGAAQNSSNARAFLGGLFLASTCICAALVVLYAHVNQTLRLTKEFSEYPAIIPVKR